MSEPYQQYINGEWVDNSGDTFTSRNPATGDTLGTFQRGTETEVDRAVAAAETAFEEWRSLSRITRAEYLWDIYHELRDRHEELGEIVTRECGKELSEGKADVTEAWHMVEWAAGDARHPKGDVVPSEIPGKDAYMRRKPRGPTACITPWNFPVAIPFWQMAVTLVEGNTVVWKPAEQTPLCGQVIAEMFDDVGVPDGVFNLVQGTATPGRRWSTTTASGRCFSPGPRRWASRLRPRPPRTPASGRPARWVAKTPSSSLTRPTSTPPSTPLL
jgi:aldehyde dehydrogenase (NAD+)